MAYPETDNRILNHKPDNPSVFYMSHSRFIFETILLCLVGFALSSTVSSHGREGSSALMFMEDEMRLPEQKLSGPSEGPGGLDEVYVGPQAGLRESDRVEALPGQPRGIDFEQFAGYVTVDPEAGRALFYYFAESPKDASSKPLVLWLNGGPGCSSFGNGAMEELGPFRVNKDGLTLYQNEYAWNLEANVIFLESPAGVGFSYSNTTSDYALSGDNRTAHDSYIFLLNWLERFPEYKTRDFYLAGESYAGHYVPQLARTILQNNEYPNRTAINLRGIAIGNAYVDFENNRRGMIDYYWTHALISDEIYDSIISSCNFSFPMTISDECRAHLAEANKAVGTIDNYNIYAPICNSSYSNKSYTFPEFDPCSDHYVFVYLNNPEVQRSLHANNSGIPYPWQSCSDTIGRLWKDRPLTVLPTLQGLMSQGLRVWLYSGDTDSVVPVTSTRYSIKKIGAEVKTSWYPWYSQGEVGGYAVGYENLTLVTVRGAGHLVPSYQPARALQLFASFLQGKLP